MLNNQNQEHTPSSERQAQDNFFEQYGIRVLKALRQIIRAVDIHSKKLVLNYQVTAPQMICLYCLEREGPMTLSQLSQSVSLGMSTTNGVVDRLEAKGLLTRKRSAVDRRRVELAVTVSGRELTRQAPALLQEQFSEALRQLPELEQAAITLSLERVVELMGGQQLDTSPNLIPGANLQPSNEDLKRKEKHANHIESTTTNH